MAVILNIETATRVCSVALAIDGEVVALKESHEKNAHAENITIFSEAVVKEAGLSLKDLDAIAVSKGPGSYTGLRIGVSTAKGFCYALDKPLIAIGTLTSLAAGMVTQQDNPADFLYCPMIDARRMEVYAALFDGDLDTIMETEAIIIDKDSFAAHLPTQPIVFAGDGAAKCKEVLGFQENAVFFEELLPSATYMAALTAQKFNDEQFEDVAYFEPFYLKDFVAGVPKVKGLR
jgi:tRNA threonylcarbamoyladenosine biosynthesis protein TsaB